MNTFFISKYRNFLFLPALRKYSFWGEELTLSFILFKIMTMKYTFTQQETELNALTEPYLCARNGAR